MANVGDQYIITLDSKMKNHNGNLYTASGMSTLVFDDTGLAKLIPYKSSMHKIQEEFAYQQGYRKAMAEIKKASEDKKKFDALVKDIGLEKVRLYLEEIK